MDSLMPKDKLMGFIMILVILIVLGSAVGIWFKPTEAFSPIDQWPYLPPRYWNGRHETHWDPWYFNNGNYLYPSNPGIANYTVQDYQFPARTLEILRKEHHMEETEVPKALPTQGLSQEMAEESNPAEQGLGPTPEEAIPQIPKQEVVAEKVDTKEGYGGGYLGARYGGARYEGYGGGYPGARYEGFGFTRRNLLIGAVVVLVAILIYRNYFKSEEIYY